MNAIFLVGSVLENHRWMISPYARQFLSNAEQLRFFCWPRSNNYIVWSNTVQRLWIRVCGAVRCGKTRRCFSQFPHSRRLSTSVNYITKHVSTAFRSFSLPLHSEMPYRHIASHELSRDYKNLQFQMNITIFVIVFVTVALSQIYSNKFLCSNRHWKRTDER